MTIIPKSIQRLCFASAFLLPITAKCDVFVLKDGTRLTGKIMKQTYEFYTLKVEIAENVLGEKKVLVKDVVEIIKDDASLKELKLIEKLFPTSDFLSIEDYERIKIQYFGKFHTNHPRSKYLKQVKKLEQQLDNEYETLKNGGAKIDGDLLSKDQIDANKYEVEAILLLHQLEHDIQKNRIISALRGFETLEKEYLHTRPYPKAADIVKGILPNFITDLTELSHGVEEEAEKKRKYIDRLSSAESKRITDLLTRDETEYQTSLSNAKDVLKTKWLPLNKYEIVPIEEVIKNAQSELSRLEKLPMDKFEDGGKLYRDILASIDDKDYDLASKQLNVFSRMKPPESYINELKIDILDIKDAAEALKERERQAAIKEAVAVKAADALKKKEEREAKKNKGKSAEDKIKKKLNIDKKQKLLKEAEELTK